jgi:multiple sugar transport system substrate-binding protein
VSRNGVGRRALPVPRPRYAPRRFLRRAAAVCIGAAVLLAGCGDTSDGTAEIVWWTPNWSQARAESLARQFEAAHPDVRVKIELTVADGLPTRIQTALRSGSSPDIIEAQHGWIPPYAQAGLLLPLDDVLEGRADYVATALDYVTWDGQLWGIPYRVDAHALFYNKSMFREAGLDPGRPPETWTELVQTARRLTKRRADGRDQYGYSITGGGEIGNTLFRSLPLIWMNGGDILSPDMTRATVNEQRAVEAVTFYTDMFTTHRVSPPSTLQDDGLASRRLFIAEAVAMYQSGQFDIATIRSENPGLDLGIAMLPRPAGREPAVVLGGWSFIVPKAARHPDRAREFVRFLTTSERMGYFTDTFPARLSAMSQPRFADPLLAPFRRMLPYGRRLPPRRDWLQIVQIYFDGVQQILLGDRAPQQAMDVAAAEIQALLDRNP